MNDQRQRVDRLPVDQDVELDERRLPVAGHVIVERREPTRKGFQSIVEVEYYLIERQLVGDHHPV